MKKQLLALFLTLSLSVILQAQSPGNSLHYDGSNDYVTCPLPTVFTNIAANPFTFEAWVYPENTSTRRIFYAQNNTTNFATILLSASNNVYFYLYSGGTNYGVMASAALPVAQWSHVAVTWNPVGNQTRIYYNGVQQVTAAPGTSSTGTSGVMTIGSRTDGLQVYQGQMDEVRIWNTAKTACQISMNMNNEMVGTEIGLLAYYDFNHGVPDGNNTGLTTLTEYVAGSNGTLTNFALTGATSNWKTSGAVISGTGLQVALTSSPSATICEGDTFVLGTQSLTTSGVYNEPFVTAAGCDSNVTLTLTVNPSYSMNISEVACEQYDFNSTILTSSGIYADTMSTINGCDSIIVLDLTIHNNETASLNEVACDQYDFNSVILTSSGLYMDTVSTINGCDSVITLNLTINNSETEVLNETACSQYIFNSELITISGTYSDTLSTMSGCDSIVILNLTINTIDNGVVQNSTVLTADATGATYQWLDCNNAFAPLVGETGQVFTASANGSYAVEVSDKGCVDTSACFVVNNVGIETDENVHFNVYPNPTNGPLYLLSTDGTAFNFVELMDINGRILEQWTSQTGSMVIDLSDFSEGIYLLNIHTQNRKYVKRIIRN